ncbi:hypothetical protein OPV22_014562 [Ensete ventricosum]|uniref:Uncharacterized protein n=1 Tax=Ensete ventricosum TaxID=4639 RepID=A0AAV8RC64_ENSVE|nr:hypothetical protein OPV22_014562 [Ensete ventricosum]
MKIQLASHALTYFCFTTLEAKKRNTVVVVMWSVATDNIISHGAGEQARRLPQLLQDLPLHGRNVTVKLSSGDNSGEGSVEVDGEERLSHSKKSSGGKGGKGVGGAGSQSLRQPRSRKSSSSTSMRRPFCSLWGIGLPSLLLLCVALT